MLINHSFRIAELRDLGNRLTTVSMETVSFVSLDPECFRLLGLTPLGPVIMALL